MSTPKAHQSTARPYFLSSKIYPFVSPDHRIYNGSLSYLRCHEFWRSAECAGRRSIPHLLLAQTVIGNLDVSIHGKENIIELQVTVDNTILVEVLQCQADFCSIELSTLSTELPTLNVQHEITTTDILHDEVNSGFCLETSVEVEQEWVTFLVGDEEDTLLRPCAFNLVVLNDKLFLEYFDGIQVLGLLGLRKHDLTEVTLTEHSQEVEIIQTNAAATLWLRWSWSDSLALDWSNGLLWRRLWLIDCWDLWRSSSVWLLTILLLLWHLSLSWWVSSGTAHISVSCWIISRLWLLAVMSSITRSVLWCGIALRAATLCSVVCGGPLICTGLLLHGSRRSGRGSRVR